jgi:hypothetical protein
MSITKSTDFQGKAEEFSNTYAYTGVEDSDAAINALIDAVVALERQIFSTVVTFVRVKVWQTNGVGPNVMRVTRDLTGAGTAINEAGMYRECVQMVRWPLPARVSLSITGNNLVKRVSRYLRKYLHTGSSHGYPISGGGAAHVVGAGLPLRTYAEGVVQPRPGAFLCSPEGDQTTAGPTFGKYLEHRQFPRGRKE